MLSEDEERWLDSKYPGLASGPSGVTGNIRFTATYNDRTRLFLILADGVPDTVGGVQLSGCFDIRIEEREDKSVSALPALFVEGVDPILDRHFYVGHKSACLCSPFEEDEFLEPTLQFDKYLEKLVIPFLYGQAFYSRHEHWPWPDYDHGSVGLLQSYSKLPGSHQATKCLRLLPRFGGWSRIRKLLTQRGEIRGHVGCLCSSARQIRLCHPEVLRGLTLLRNDVKVLRLKVQ